MKTSQVLFYTIISGDHAVDIDTHQRIVEICIQNLEGDAAKIRLCNRNHAAYKFGAITLQEFINALNVLLPDTCFFRLTETEEDEKEPDCDAMGNTGGIIELEMPINGAKV